jgi:hypothetical protein
MASASIFTYHAAPTTLLFDKSSIDIFVSNSGELLLWLKQQRGRVPINLTQTHHPMPRPSQDSSLQYDFVVAAPPEPLLDVTPNHEPQAKH